MGRYRRGNKKIQKGKLDDAKEQSGNIEGAIRRYHMGNQKIPEEWSEDTNSVIKI
jgi:hypothetical protein